MHRSLRIGHTHPVLGFRHPTMLAPMEGVTHPLLRTIMAERGGLGIVCTEFVRIGRSPLSPKALVREVQKSPGVPLSVQVMGNEADKMAEAAGVVARAGADVVDINLGCPAPRVVRKGVGSAMLKDVRLLGEVVGAMRAQVPGLLSAKIRAGFDDASNVLEIGRTLERVGVDFLVVHPRRRCDFYEGVADWRTVKLLKDALRIPVVGNGDVWYAADVLRMQAETGCDAVMIGRPALRNPWIFEQAADLLRGKTPRRPSGKELFAWILEVAERYRGHELGHSERSVGKLKELLGYLGRAVPDQRSFQRAVLRLGTRSEILSHAEAVLSPIAPEGLDLGAHGELGLERSGRV
ncbi:MAG: tRNA-dihydrouridine synthase [Myxococcota bacterium]